MSSLARSSGVYLDGELLCVTLTQPNDSTKLLFNVRAIVGDVAGLAA
ncbi:hypothetical protein QO058_14015 [Bosea vestrisii]|nr:hypothetical protein [Bosea vestrisii]WID99253.1 hypothetical protein QO058_14015 [Bosea vestrisii]